MNYSDDMEIRDNTQSDEVRQGFDAGKTPDAQHDTDTRNGFYGELVAISLKAVAVALSLVLLITSILAVALPLSAMRVFNKLGNSARALDFGDRYISRELDKLGAETDELGNYTGLARVTSAGDGLVEAFDVSIGLAYKLMNKYAAKGDKASVLYYARRLEQYTRMYMSLGDAPRLIAEKDELRVSGVPTLAMRPFVYSYGHDMRVMNYRARTYLGETDKMLYNSRRIGDSVWELDRAARSYNGQDPNSVEDSAARANLLDDFVDYASQLGAYLSVELDRLGVSGTYSESDMQDKYTNVLTGDEFSLFITRADGYTTTYELLKNFSDYSRAAYEFTASTFDERLRQLYWLQELSSASTKLWYMSMLLYFNRDMYGASKTDIINDYNYNDGTCARYRFVWFDTGGEQRGILISELYVQKFEQYLTLIKGGAE